MIRYGAQRARLNYGLGVSGLRGPEPKCKSINQSVNKDVAGNGSHARVMSDEQVIAGS